MNHAMTEVTPCLPEEGNGEFPGTLKKERMVDGRGAPEVDRTHPGIGGY